MIVPARIRIRLDGECYRFIRRYAVAGYLGAYATDYLAGLNIRQRAIRASGATQANRTFPAGQTSRVNQIDGFVGKMMQRLIHLLQGRVYGRDRDDLRASSERSASK